MLAKKTYRFPRHPPVPVSFFYAIVCFRIAAGYLFSDDPCRDISARIFASDDDVFFDRDTIFSNDTDVFAVLDYNFLFRRLSFLSKI